MAKTKAALALGIVAALLLTGVHGAPARGALNALQPGHEYGAPRLLVDARILIYDDDLFGPSVAARAVGDLNLPYDFVQPPVCPTSLLAGKNIVIIASHAESLAVICGPGVFAQLGAYALRPDTTLIFTDWELPYCGWLPCTQDEVDFLLDALGAQGPLVPEEHAPGLRSSTDGFCLAELAPTPFQPLGLYAALPPADFWYIVDAVAVHVAASGSECIEEYNSPPSSLVTQRCNDFYMSILPGTYRYVDYNLNGVSDIEDLYTNMIRIAQLGLPC